MSRISNDVLFSDSFSLSWILTKEDHKLFSDFVLMGSFALGFICVMSLAQILPLISEILYGPYTKKLYIEKFLSCCTFGQRHTVQFSTRSIIQLVQ